MLVIAGFWIFALGSSIGTGPVAFVYISEVFPTAYRAKGVAICVFVSRSFSVLVMVSYPLLIESIGPAWLFSLRAIVSSVCFALVFATARETRGVS